MDKDDLAKIKAWPNKPPASAADETKQQIVTLMHSLTDEQRLEALYDVGMCTHCGRLVRGCQCDNDE